MGVANSGATQPNSLPDRYRAFLPQSSATGDAAHQANARHLEQTINQLPVDSAFLWLGAGSSRALSTGVETPLNLDGTIFASEGFKVDITNRLITVDRAGWYEFNIGVLDGSPQAISAILIINNNTAASPYPSPQMNFFSADNTGNRAQGVLSGPVGVRDTVQIGGFLGSSPGNVQVENVFARWTRPYYV